MYSAELVAGIMTHWDITSESDSESKEFAWTRNSRWIKRTPKQEFHYLMETTEALALDINTKLFNKTLIQIYSGLQQIYNFDTQIIGGLTLSGHTPLSGHKCTKNGTLFKKIIPKSS